MNFIQHINLAGENKARISKGSPTFSYSVEYIESWTMFLAFLYWSSQPYAIFHNSLNPSKHIGNKLRIASRFETQMISSNSMRTLKISYFASMNDNLIFILFRVLLKVSAIEPFFVCNTKRKLDQNWKTLEKLSFASCSVSIRGWKRSWQWIEKQSYATYTKKKRKINLQWRR